MRQLCRLFLLPLALSGCAGRLYHDRAVVQNGAYYAGSWLPSARYILSPQRPDHEVRTGNEMMSDLLASAWLLAQNPDYYQKSTIGGHCVRGTEGPVSVQALCVNVTFVVSDGSGKTVSRLFSENGVFQFYSEPDQVYFVSVWGPHQNPLGRVGPVRMGDEVVIRVPSVGLKLGARE